MLFPILQFSIFTHVHYNYVPCTIILLCYQIASNTHTCNWPLGHHTIAIKSHLQMISYICNTADNQMLVKLISRLFGYLQSIVNDNIVLPIETDHEKTAFTFVAVKGASKIPFSISRKASLVINAV